LKNEIGTRDEVGALTFPEGYQSYLSSGYGNKEKRENLKGSTESDVSAKVDKFAKEQERKQQAAKKSGKNGKVRNGRLKR
jgi:hypothetical protein